MSTGVADEGMRRLGKDCPLPLPVQALDHATGYLMAAAVIRGLTSRLSSGRGFEVKASLARTAALLIERSDGPATCGSIVADKGDWSPEIERTAYGPVYRLKPPIQIGDAPMRWDRPATTLGSSPAAW